jgi:hypothetical protein
MGSYKVTGSTGLFLEVGDISRAEGDISRAEGDILRMIGEFSQAVLITSETLLITDVFVAIVGGVVVSSLATESCLLTSFWYLAS